MGVSLLHISIILFAIHFANAEENILSTTTESNENENVTHSFLSSVETQDAIKNILFENNRNLDNFRDSDGKFILSLLPQKCRDHIIKNKLLNDENVPTTNLDRLEENTKQYIQPLVKSNLSLFYQKVNQTNNENNKDGVTKKTRYENTNTPTVQIQSEQNILPVQTVQLHNERIQLPLQQTVQIHTEQTQLPQQIAQQISVVNSQPNFETPQIEIYPASHDSSSFLQTLKDYANQWRYKWLQNPLTTIQTSPNTVKYNSQLSNNNHKYSYYPTSVSQTIPNYYIQPNLTLPTPNYYIKPNFTIPIPNYYMYPNLTLPNQKNITVLKTVESTDSNLKRPIAVNNFNSERIEYVVKPLDMNRYSYYPYVKYPIPYSQSFFYDNLPVGNTINNSKYPTTIPQNPPPTQQPSNGIFEMQTMENSGLNGKFNLNNFYLTKLLSNNNPSEINLSKNVEIPNTTTSSTSTTTTTAIPITSESSKIEELFIKPEEPIYDQQLRFVLPLYIPTPDPKTVTKFPWEFDPYAYYPPNFRPSHIKVPLPYKPTYHAIRRLAIPNEYLKYYEQKK